LDWAFRPVQIYDGWQNKVRETKNYSRLQVHEVQVFNSKARYRAKFTSDS